MGRPGSAERFVRAHPGLADLAATGGALLAAFGSVFYVAELAGWPVALLLHVPPPLAVAVRRWFPRSVLGVTLALSLLQWALAVPYGGAQVSVLIALYTVSRSCSLRDARAGLGTTLALVLIGPLRQPYTDVIDALFVGLLVVLVYVLGTNVQLRVQYLRELEARAVRLEQERDAAAGAAAAQERARIARELHDVVAHHVSVMVVQAEGAGWAVDSDPAAARAAVATIGATGRTALTELRHLLGVLRTEQPEGTAPQPVLADLGALAERFRASGLAVTLVPPVAGDVPEIVQLAAFRVVQESLTNVLKHAGPGAAAEVTVAREPGRLTVLVCDNGIGESTGTSGHGLIGIRERAALFGGRSGWGPRAEGGFRVWVELPC